MSVLVGAPVKAPRKCIVGYEFSMPWKFMYKDFFKRLRASADYAPLEINNPRTGRPSNINFPAKLEYVSTATNAVAATYEVVRQQGQTGSYVNPVKPLGKGGFGAVCEYKLVSVDPSRRFPPSITLKASFEDDDQVALSKLDSAGIQMPWFTLLPESRRWAAGAHYMLMPRFDGDLFEVNHRTQLSDSEIVNIMIKVLEMLKPLHDKKFVYMDLKPGNIFYFACGPGEVVPVQVFLGDIGSIRTTTRGDGEVVATIWTPEYMFDPDARDVSSMLWICGVMMLEFTGADPGALYHTGVKKALAEIRQPGRGLNIYRTGHELSMLRQTLHREAKKLLVGAKRDPLMMALLEKFLGSEISPSTYSLDSMIEHLKAAESQLDAKSGSAPQPQRANDASMKQLVTFQQKEAGATANYAELLRQLTIEKEVNASLKEELAKYQHKDAPVVVPLHLAVYVQDGVVNLRGRTTSNVGVAVYVDPKDAPRTWNVAFFRFTSNVTWNVNVQTVSEGGMTRIIDRAKRGNFVKVVDATDARVIDSTVYAALRCNVPYTHIFKDDSPATLVSMLHALGALKASHPERSTAVTKMLEDTVGNEKLLAMMERMQKNVPSFFKMTAEEDKDLLTHFVQLSGTPLPL